MITESKNKSIEKPLESLSLSNIGPHGFKPNLIIENPIRSTVDFT